MKIYDRGFDFKTTTGIHKFFVSYLSGDMYTPKVSTTEALMLEATYFLECVNKGIDPFNNVEAGLKVVKMLEATDQPLKNGDNKVDL